jgi:hypothetical protein
MGRAMKDRQYFIWQSMIRCFLVILRLIGIMMIMVTVLSCNAVRPIEQGGNRDDKALAWLTRKEMRFDILGPGERKYGMIKIIFPDTMLTQHFDNGVEYDGIVSIHIRKDENGTDMISPKFTKDWAVYDRSMDVPLNERDVFYCIRVLVNSDHKYAEILGLASTNIVIDNDGKCGAIALSNCEFLTKEHICDQEIVVYMLRSIRTKTGVSFPH